MLMAGKENGLFLGKHKHKLPGRSTLHEEKPVMVFHVFHVNWQGQCESFIRYNIKVNQAIHQSTPAMPHPPLTSTVAGHLKCYTAHGQGICLPT